MKGEKRQLKEGECFNKAANEMLLATATVPIRKGMEGQMKNGINVCVCGKHEVLRKENKCISFTGNGRVWQSVCHSFIKIFQMTAFFARP